MKLNTDKIRIMQGGETQEQLAERAGISRVGFSNMLNRGTCHPASLVRIAAALGVEPIELIKE